MSIFSRAFSACFFFFLCRNGFKGIYWHTCGHLEVGKVGVWNLFWEISDFFLYPASFVLLFFFFLLFFHFFPTRHLECLSLAQNKICFYTIVCQLHSVAPLLMWYFISTDLIFGWYQFLNDISVVFALWQKRLLQDLDFLNTTVCCCQMTLAPSHWYNIYHVQHCPL